MTPAATQAEPVPDAKPALPRLAALDAFRGLTILLMLLVNNTATGEATPEHLTHAEWSGAVHLADVVFPWFLLAVGVAIPFAVASHRKKNAGFLSYYNKAVKRTATLVLLGILVDSTVNHAWSPGLGVLQIIGLAYLLAAFLSPLPTLWRGITAVGLLAAHTGILLLWHVPGLGVGRIEPEANVVAFVNEIYLQPWGLRGLLSVIPTTAMVLLGTIIGDLYRRTDLAVARRALLCAAGGVLLATIGYAGSFVLPMNKPLWTATYILYTAGLGALLLALLHRLVDGTKHGAAFALVLLIPGANAITAYVLPILVKINILQSWSAATDAGHVSIETALQNSAYAVAGRVNGGWLYTAGYIAAWWMVLYYFHRKQWFLRV